MLYKITCYVPETHLEEVKAALFEKGAGKVGDYDCCCWQVRGAGQFRPLAGSQPYLGEAGKIERVDEYRLEMVCESVFIRDALLALISAHPYEEPAYDVLEVLTLTDLVSE